MLIPPDDEKCVYQKCVYLIDISCSNNPDPYEPFLLDLMIRIILCKTYLLILQALPPAGFAIPPPSTSWQVKLAFKPLAALQRDQAPHVEGCPCFPAQGALHAGHGHAVQNRLGTT